MIGPKWLSEAVFYEVYPQSFLDTNGDGIGDIKGIIAKLDYIKSLGCNAIWLNPCFESPFGDAGYDISDFYKVAPRYGTNKDLARLFAQAKKRGMHVVLDLVAGHTSVEHPWFKESCTATKNKHTNRYIWTDSVWQHDNDLRMIQGYGERDGNYACNFFWFQPALNYGFAKANPKKPWQLPMNHPDCVAMREELKKIMRFWLDMGAGGFRVDMAASLVKGDTGGKHIAVLWQEMREMFDRDYPEAALIAEWFNPPAAVKAGFHVDFMSQGCGVRRKAYHSLLRNDVKRSERSYFRLRGHSFFDRDGKGDIMDFLIPYMQQYKAIKGTGYISLYSGNHDLSRVSIGRNQRDIEVVFAFLLTMPGTPFIYYGDEIGMKYLNLTSKEGGYDRTGSRTPMQWTTGKNAGFSKADKDSLYLPIDPDQTRPSVEEQEKLPRSLLNKVRALVRLRRQYPLLGADADFIPLYAKAREYPFVYMRKAGNERMLIAINPAARKVKARFRLSGFDAAKLVAGKGTTIKSKTGICEISMDGASFGIFEGVCYADV